MSAGRCCFCDFERTLMKFVSIENLENEGVSHNREIKKKVMLKRGDLPHLTGFSRAVFIGGQTADAHSHNDMCEVFYVEEGEGLFRINEKEYQLKKGVCIAVEPGERHEIVNIGEADLVILYFGIMV